MTDPYRILEKMKPVPEKKVNWFVEFLKDHSGILLFFFAIFVFAFGFGYYETKSNLAKANTCYVGSRDNIFTAFRRNDIGKEEKLGFFTLKDDAIKYLKDVKNCEVRED